MKIRYPVLYLQHGGAGEDHQAHWLAHLPAYLFDFPEGEWGRREGGTGDPAARDGEDDA
ncbi:MAG TPA: hypothetical protein VHD85_22055 [Terracidiphilus sp.]|nr:hypothetical protein [Terracidiphilus sp.]